MAATKGAQKAVKKVARKTASKRSGARRNSPTTAARDEQVGAISDETSSVVRKAADVFQSEFSGGVDEARRLQKVFTERETLEPGDLDELAARVRSNAHLLIDAVSRRIDDFNGGDVRDLTERFTKDAHSVLDAFVDLADLAPRFVNSAMETAKSIRPDRDAKPQPAEKNK